MRVTNPSEEVEDRQQIEIDVDEEDILKCQLSQANNEFIALKFEYDLRIQELTREIEELKQIRNTATGGENRAEYVFHEIINQKEARIISMLAIILNNADKNILEIYAAIRRLDGTITMTLEDIESILKKYPSCFQKINTVYEARWRLRILTN